MSDTTRAHATTELELRATLYELLLALDALVDTTAAGSNDVVAVGWRALAVDAVPRLAAATAVAARIRRDLTDVPAHVRAATEAIDDLARLYAAFTKMAVGHKRRLAAATLSRELARLKARALAWAPPAIAKTTMPD